MSSDLETTVKFTPSVIDGMAANDSILRGIAEAETVDDLFASTGTLKLTDIEGELVSITNCAFHEANDQFKDGGWGIFAVMTLADGRVITTGGKTVVLKLYKLAELTGYPLPFNVVFKSNQTKSGYTVWDMDKEPESTE